MKWYMSYDDTPLFDDLLRQYYLNTERSIPPLVISPTPCYRHDSYGLARCKMSMIDSRYILIEAIEQWLVGV